MSRLPMMPLRFAKASGHPPRLTLRCALLVCLLAIAARADSRLNVLIVDPAHTDGGEAAAAVLGNWAQVRKVDITQLRQIDAPSVGVVVWLSPEPLLYQGAALAQWQKVLQDKRIGLMILGLPHDQAGCEALSAALRGRMNLKIGPALDRHLSGASWIWGELPTAERQRVHLRRSFTLESLPRRAWIEFAADNRASVRINGAPVGSCDDWRTPAAFDITPLLHRGENQIDFDAWNDDGPAGVAAALSGRDGSGREIFRLVTDHTWPEARVIAPLGGGPWEDKVRDSFVPDEVTVKHSDRAVIAGLPEVGGRVAVLHALQPQAGAQTLLAWEDLPVAIANESAGARTILFAGEMAKTTPNAKSPTFLEQGFDSFLRAGVAWLGHVPLNESAPIARGNDQAGAAATRPAGPPPRVADSAFPVVIQFSPIPHEGVVTPTQLPLTARARHRLIDNLIDHGCTVLQCPLPLPANEARDVENYAQDRGMGIAYLFEHGLEGFGRESPPDQPVTSVAYQRALAQRLDARLGVLKGYRRLRYILPMQDEPFHVGAESFDYRPAHQAALAKHFTGYQPQRGPIARNDPRWVNFLDVNSMDFPIAWQAIDRWIKPRYPGARVLINHDSHNVFGGAAGQEGEIFVDDVFHWGSSYADAFSFDIYPYLMTDFRYGPNRTLKLPRMAQMHFALAQLEDLGRSEKQKQLGYYFGTYNPEWFDLTAKGRAQYWMSREMAYTALAGGADVLLAGLNVPIDWRHWEDLGEALRTIQKAGPQLIESRKERAAAAMVFPRYQCEKLQEEYWNVATSFEIFQRAFGELDCLHEQQVAQELSPRLYPMLTLFDVKLLEPGAADAMEKYLQRGGVVLADCVPASGELNHPCGDWFGVRDAKTDRILWPQKWPAKSSAGEPTKALPATQASDRAAGSAFGLSFDFPIVSARPFQVTDAQVLLKSAAGAPLLVRKITGRGRAYLLGFCLQDTAFHAWRTHDRRALEQIEALLRAIARDGGVEPHVFSSNPDIEAALRQLSGASFLIVIAHEPAASRTRLTLNSLDPSPRRIVDVASGESIAFQKRGHAIELDLDMPTGATRLLRIQ